MAQLESYVPKDWTLLAEIDESYPYEIDVTEIYRDGRGYFVLATAAGCSCWDGEYDEETYATYPELVAALNLLTAPERTYNPSPVGATDLLAQVQGKMALLETKGAPKHPDLHQSKSTYDPNLN
jgi:hypothetical protein